MCFDKMRPIEWRRPCQFTFVGRFLCRSPPIELVKAFTVEFWKTSSPPLVIDMEMNHFLFRFPSAEDALLVLTEGPWTIGGGEAIHIIIPWHPDFQPLQETVQSSPVWVQFPGLPFEDWNHESLSKINYVIDCPIKINLSSYRVSMQPADDDCSFIALFSPSPHHHNRTVNIALDTLSCYYPTTPSL